LNTIESFLLRRLIIYLEPSVVKRQRSDGGNFTVKGKHEYISLCLFWKNVDDKCLPKTSPKTAYTTSLNEVGID